jgi:uncharacterized protein
MARWLLLAVCLAAAPAGAVMDCSRAKSNAEKMICSNARLMRADEELAMAWREAIRRGVDPQALMQGQRAWLHDVRDACNDVDCMLRAYRDRIADLDNQR